MKKTTKKRNDKTIFIVAIVLFAMAAGLFVGAYARFQTTVTGTATLTTANWSFKVNGSTESFTVDLSKGTVTNYISAIVGGEEVKKIIPGSYGEFTLTLSAEESEVPVTYNAEFGAIGGTSVPANLLLYKDAAHTQNLQNISGEVIPAGESIPFTIYWLWGYGEDVDDTGFSGQELELPITITGYQVDTTPTVEP